MAGRLALLLCVLAVPATPAWAGSVPTHQSFDLRTLGVSFELPSDWGKDLPPDSGWQWQAMAPGATAHLYVSAVRTSKSFSQIVPVYVSAIKTAIARNDYQSVVTMHSLHIGSTPAVEVGAHYRQRTSAALQRVVSNLYIFAHAGRFYIFNYSASTDWIKKVQPSFDQSIRSVSFPNAA